MEHFLIWLATGLLLALGLAGSLVPSLPGPPLILAGAMVYAFFNGLESVGWPILVVLAVLAVVMQVLDYLAGIYGAKRLGGTRAGVIGCLIGSLVGLFTLGLPGLLLGTFIGSAAGEMIWAGQNLAGSLKVGLGSLLGLLASSLIRILVSLAMVVVFLIKVL